MGLRDVAGEREQQGNGVLRGRDDGRLGRVRDDDPAAGRRGDVHVVDPDSRAADHLQPLRPLEKLRGDLRPAPDDQRVVLADPLRQVELGVDVDVEPLP